MSQDFVAWVVFQPMVVVDLRSLSGRRSIQMLRYLARRHTSSTFQPPPWISVLSIAV